MGNILKYGGFVKYYSDNPPKVDCCFDNRA